MSVALLAVHLSDGVLVWPWLLGGFLLAAIALGLCARRIDDDEIPRIGILTAAFFVASSIRVPVGPTSVHLLLNGLVGILLGPRAVIAVAVGLVLQAVLLGHGGYSALGINAVIIAVPALLARPLYHYLIHCHRDSQSIAREGFLAFAYVLHPAFMLPFLVATFISIRSGWRQRVAPEFRAGFLVGFVGVLLTAGLNAIVLVVAGIEDWRIVAVAVFAAHIPIAFIEGFIVGFAVSFLKRVKPETLSV